MRGLRLNPNLLAVPLYVAGKPIEAVQQEYGLTHVVKLGSNENPIGPSPLALAAYRRALMDAHRYPATGDLHLREKLASRYNARYGAAFTENNFLTGNGLGDVLRMIVEAFVFDGGETILCAPTFPLYRILTQQYGGQCKSIPHRNYRQDLSAMADAITAETRLIFVCNPNNPTGTLVTREEVAEFMSRVPASVVVVFDESYSELVDDPNYSNIVQYVQGGRDQVLLLRGFSKIYGLANLRIGFALGTHAMIEYLHHAQIVFNTGDPVLYAAMAAMDDETHIASVRELIAVEKRFMYEGLAELDLTYIPTEANFVLLVDLPREAQSIYEGLLRRGVIIRPTDGFGLPNALRVTIGTHAENVAFIQALRAVLADHNR
jgi:histidinol-phosphate aminotransferase